METGKMEGDIGWGGEAHESLAVVEGVRVSGPGVRGGPWMMGTRSHCVSTMSTDSLQQQGNPLAPGKEKEVRARLLRVGGHP